MAVDTISSVKCSTYVQKPKKTGGFGKAVASTFVPGLGQLLDGRKVKGIGFFSALSLMAYGVIKNIKNLGKNIIGSLSQNCKQYATEAAEGKKLKISGKILKSASKNVLALCGLLILGAVTHIACIIDAYKGSKQK